MTALHTFFGLAALLAGLAVLLGPKGTAAHRRVGMAYVASMVGLCAGSFAIGEGRFFGFGGFHLLALVSLATVGMGAVPALLRPRPSWWLDAHFQSMAWSYVGLVMALGSHLSGPLSRQLAAWTGSPGAGGIAAVLLLWGVPPLVCRRLLARREALYRERFGLARAVPGPEAVHP